MNRSRRQLLRLLSQTPAAILAATAAWAGNRTRAQGLTSELAGLQNALRDRVIVQDSAEYEPLRRSMVWNAVKPSRFPAAIVRARSAADVREAIRFSRERGWMVAVRGGGHNWHNAALRQGGLLLDLSGLNQVVVDQPRARAIVEPGIKGAALTARLTRFGLTFPVAANGQVPLSGFLLNGGLSGPNYRAWGPSCLSVDALDIITATGESIHANATENADFFWAARGAGSGFFGVVTRFHIKLLQLPSTRLRSTLRLPPDATDRLPKWLERFIARAGDTAISLGWSFSNGAWSLVATATADSVAEARRALEHLEFEQEFPGLAVEKMLYRQVGVVATDSTNIAAQQGPRYAGDTLWSNAPPAELISAVRDAVLAGAPGGTVSFNWMGRDQTNLPDMAFSKWGSTYCHCHTIWNDPADDARNHTWLRSTVSGLERIRAGYYVGEADLAVAPDRASQCFSPEAWRRLTALKQKHDPENRFFSFLQAQ